MIKNKRLAFMGAILLSHHQNIAIISRWTDIGLWVENKERVTQNLNVS